MLAKFVKEIINSIGFKTDRKFIVFCSDDWGGIRVRSNEFREKLLLAGISLDSNRFDRFDTLESNQDLEALFDLLLKYKDAMGNYPVITAVMNVANPDFAKISENGFEQYYFEPFTATLERYPNRDKVYALYREGIARNIFEPQFHGREHVQIGAWMKGLQIKDLKTVKGFDLEFFFLGKTDVNLVMAGEYAEALNFWDGMEVSSHQNLIFTGIELFEKLFSYRPVYFAAPAQPFSDRLALSLRQNGIRLIEVAKWRRVPVGEGMYKRRFHYLGQRNRLGQFYVTRNAVFEGNLPGSGVSECMAQIEQAFRHRNPAIISNHRASFVGGLSESNRKDGLKKLDQLLRSILLTWPDVEFIGMKQLFSLMEQENG